MSEKYDLVEKLRSLYFADEALLEQAADRIEQLVATCEELEAKLLSATMDGYDMAKYEYRDRIEELEAKLAKAVETISLCRKMQAQFAHTEDPLMVLLDTTIAELSSVSCANLKGQNDE